jgi:hypothetical protein
MRQIFHTCLLAIRLISGTAATSVSALQQLNVLDAALLNAAFAHIYLDPGADRRLANKAYELYPASVISCT